MASAISAPELSNCEALAKWRENYEEQGNVDCASDGRPLQFESLPTYDPFETVCGSIPANATIGFMRRMPDHPPKPLVGVDEVMQFSKIF